MAVEDPDACTREADESINYYRRGIIAKYPGMYLHVVVRRADAERARVVTAWPARSIDPYEELLWIRGMTKS